MIQITVSSSMAEELLQWVEDEAAHWPPGTVYQDELVALRDEIAAQTGKERIPHQSGTPKAEHLPSEMPKSEAKNT